MIYSPSPNFPVGKGQSVILAGGSETRVLMTLIKFIFKS